jgi:hypothetical protein
MTQITYIKSALNHSSAMTTPAVALTEFGLWKSIKRAFKKYAKPLAAIVGIAASIAVPFIAPAVAGMIFGGTALGAGAIGAAIAGAGMGAAAGALTAYGTGQNVLMGAGLGLLGGAVGGGLSGFGQTGTLLGNTADAVYGSGMAASAISGPGAAAANITPAGQTLTTADGATWNVIGGAAPGTVTAAPVSASATSGIGSKLLNAAIQAAPGAIGSVVAGLSDADAAQAQAELQAEMARLQQSDMAAYQKARELYDTLVATYGQIDPTALAQSAEADVQRRVAQQSSENLRNIEMSGGASGKQYKEAEERRLQIEGAGMGSTAYGNEYWRAFGAKLQGQAGLLGNVPRYDSRTSQYLQGNLTRAEGRQAGLASDIAGILTPFAEEFRPRDTTLTSADEEELRVRRRLGDRNFASFE